MFRGDQPTLEDFDEDWDAYDAFVTPSLVEKISAALVGLSEEDLLVGLKKIGYAQRKREQPEYLATFECLKAAYAEAAKNKTCLRIFIC